MATKRRSNGEVENSAYAAFMRRVMKAYAKRVGAGDVAALSELVALRDELDEYILAAVAELRAEPWAYSWAQIGEVLGMSRQAAQKRFAEAGGARKVGGQPGHLR